MKSSKTFSGGGSFGASGSRSRPKCKENVGHKHVGSQEETIDFAMNIARMEHTLQAQTLSARLHLFKQQAAWWKSQFVAVEYENRMLKQLLDQIYQVPSGSSQLARQLYSSISSLSTHSQKSKKRSKNKKKNSQQSAQNSFEENEESDESAEFDEISDELRQFLDTSRLHREERERNKALLEKEQGCESETDRVERMEQEPTDEAEQMRREQLRLLYGDSWRHVEGLETYVQMKYDQFCDRNKPAYWPNIPFNL